MSDHRKWAGEEVWLVWLGPDRILAAYSSGRTAALLARSVGGDVVCVALNPWADKIDAGLVPVDADHRGHGAATLLEDELEGLPDATPVKWAET